MTPWRLAAAFLLATSYLYAQDADIDHNSAGHIPLIAGGAGYVHNVSGGVTTLEPQIDPVLLIPLGSHLLIESRTDFTGFFQRESTDRGPFSGPFSGKVFKNVYYAQLDWLANTHVMATVGKYVLPFGIYNERLQPIWIRNLQDPPINFPIGTRTSGAGDGVMLRGVITQTPKYSVQYTTYFSASSKINQLEAARTAGYDVSVYLPERHIEVGTSYQRFLQDQRSNSVAVYTSWQPIKAPLDLKAEYDHGFSGQGYWIEPAYMLSQVPVAHKFFQHVQTVVRMQQFFPLNGGGNGLQRVDTQRFDFGLNYYIRDDLRLITNYGRQFSSQGNANQWNFGFTYRMLFPLWPGRKG
jgi:hypothetical protein